VSPIEFYIAAGCVGMVMGGIQALSRSTYAKLMPETKDATSFFSFYDVSEKIGIVIGTFIYGVLAQGTGDLRNGIIMFGVFFLLGGLMLRRVK
jgi:UMF1 family MFS transporter